ncbi:MAG: DNA polymerase III subunit alpha, partial [Flavobacteriales bacterium]|nr:DNA polymerase III subunit alpha [Flavobacteriales bacterium]
ESIIAERTEDGNFVSIFDLTTRTDLRAANKKCMESLAISGAFDSFGDSHRAQYFHDDGTGIFLEKAIKYGANTQAAANSSQVSLFGGSSEVQLPEPVVPVCEEWGNIQTLKREKEVVGVYISGHPLNDFQLAMKRYCNVDLARLQTEEAKKSPQEYKFAGVVSSVQHKMSQKGNPYGIFELEDKLGNMEIRLFGEDYTKFRQYIDVDYFLYLKGAWKEKRWGNQPEGAAVEKDFKLLSIELLNEVLEKKTSSIVIDLPLAEIGPENITDLRKLLAQYEGKCKVNVRVRNTEGEKIDMHSKKMRVKPDQQLVYDLQDMGLEVALK